MLKILGTETTGNSYTHTSVREYRDVRVLWNQTERMVLANKSDVIFMKKERKICSLTNVAIS
jgi:hypothetical protein